MRFLPSLLVATLALGTCSCANYTIERVAVKIKDGKPDWNAMEDDPGYHFYAPEPYLMIKQDLKVAGGSAETSWVSEIIYLPNLQRKYRVVTSNFLAKSDFTFAFKDGWMLTSIADKGDNTAVMNEMLKTAQKAIETVGGMGKSQSPADGGPQPSKDAHLCYIFRFNYGEDGLVKSMTLVSGPPATTEGSADNGKGVEAIKPFE